MIKVQRLEEIKKICACIPFIDNGNGVTETQQAMKELIENYEKLRDHLTSDVQKQLADISTKEGDSLVATSSQEIKLEDLKSHEQT